jgi:hypothetical protein
MERYISAVLFVAILLVAIVAWRSRGRRLSAGPGAVGTIHDLLNQEKRNAIEIIVEEKAAYRDPEDRDGNLPDLEDPGRRSR